MTERYVVDCRVGCVAVVDATMSHPSPGLHSDDSHVVRYWHGRRIPRWKRALRLAPEFGAWEVPARTQRKARRLADRLNREEADHEV